ncbi:di-trans,poly-cis-decaprenylcistransferase [Candidatus Berkiella aquae]|uniref:Ditrans,polycis-undecaprenyl-diphosphate synthase ((2E,6E)-farnesyl-diphosphate specific) n=2 Tax=Candidatus Berkiella aquae TaxID=295108 RepID=A0A0Q9YYB9_9GAMM|nr:di-trans,poly-cis-decaprenylcistransferase [Candidatus Berkiella aquae]
MDGNGRWAKARHISRTLGHRKGVESAREIISACQRFNIKVLTLFAFGMENWKRPSKEVRNLFRLFYLVLRKDIARIHQDNIRLRIIGDRTIFAPALINAISDAEAMTAHNTGLVLNIAVNYSGRWDLLQAVRKVCHTHQANAMEITEAAFTEHLCLHALPEPDLFIRTGGVQRISNFMLWELAYTEFFFTPTLWPDFTSDELAGALASYAKCERRFGLTGDQLG